MPEITPHLSASRLASSSPRPFSECVGMQSWRLGLHPDQSSAAVNGPSPPAWWHAAGLRYATARPASS